MQKLASIGFLILSLLATQKAEASSCRQMLQRLVTYSFPIFVAAVDLTVNLTGQSKAPRRERLRGVSARNLKPLIVGSLIYASTAMISQRISEKSETSVLNDILPQLVEGPYALTPQDKVLYISSDYHSLFERDRNWLMARRPDLRPDQFDHISISFKNQLYGKLLEDGKQYTHVFLVAHHSPDEDGIASLGASMFDSGLLKKWEPEWTKVLDPTKVTFIRYSCYGICSIKDLRETQNFVGDLAHSSNRTVIMLSSPRRVVGKGVILDQLLTPIAMNPAVSGSVLGIEFLVDDYLNRESSTVNRAFDSSVKLVETTAEPARAVETRVILSQ